ncbi:Triacylglycerol lipase [Nitrospira japonica]|uniref:Triacylglycerol lipase n=1 Tax=Nitrospira japonica TaxID=1325564 RepID=A0A1W1IAS1_9BACT|nr:lipase family protein [Nitrospira japonica]SLM49873.1 Triacylglycerol lipase [Nitrospira japonica]
MKSTRVFTVPSGLALAVVGLVLAGLPSCGSHKPIESVPSAPPDFSRVLQYAQRADLAYQQDEVIRQQSGTSVRVSVSPPLASGVKAYVEVDDAARVQWIVIRGTSNLVNIRADVDYNKVVESRLQIPLHKGFGDAALQVYQFAKPLLKTDYETRVTGHSYGGAAAVVVLMLLKEDGIRLGQAVTFGQPKVTNRAGVRKYGSLPLIRYVNDKDPVPLLPPFEVFAVLDEGPFQHLGPEVVLEDGKRYRYYAEHQAEHSSVLSFWNNLKNLSIQDVPEHFMATYLARIKQLVP